MRELLSEATRLRTKAKETRALAQMIFDSQSREILMKLAANYDRLASDAEGPKGQN